MSAYIRGQPGQPIGFRMNSVETGLGLAGVPVVVFINKDNGPDVAGAGVVYDKGNGHYIYVPTAAEFDCKKLSFFAFGPGVCPVEKTVPTFDGAPDVGFALVVNQTLDAFIPGDAIALQFSPAGGLLATNADPSLPAIGLATTGAAPGETERVQLLGPLTLEDWTDLIGAPDLTPAAYYWLGPDGMLTDTAPTTPGLIVQLLGQASTLNTFIIAVGPRILL